MRSSEPAEGDASMEYLILRFDAPLQAWGSVAMDPRRPTAAFPTLSGITGLLASALGWRYRDAERTNTLQSRIHYAAREDVPPVGLRDYQTADLGRIGSEGWTRWGIEKRGGGPASKGTQILEKDYLAGAVFTVALFLQSGGTIHPSEIAAALERPARPLFLGRRACIPASRLLQGTQAASTPYEALSTWPVEARVTPPLRCWYSEGEGPEDGERMVVSDQRDFLVDRFTGTRIVQVGAVEPPTGSHPAVRAT